MTEVIAFPMGDAKGRTSYVVPDGVTKIGHYAFKPGTYYVCQLTSIELPRTLKEIEGAGLSCYEITSITCAAKNPPVATESSFYEVRTSATITVPTGKTAAYKAAPGWSKFTNYVEKDFPAAEIEIIDPDKPVRVIQEDIRRVEVRLEYGGRKLSVHLLKRCPVIRPQLPYSFHLFLEFKRKCIRIILPSQGIFKYLIRFIARAE